MPSFDQASRSNNGRYWSGIAGMLAIQFAVLFALSAAAIVYVNWSSDAALAEFIASSKPSATEPSHLPQPVPLQQVKSGTACPRRG
jgi:hypothetical protein